MRWDDLVYGEIEIPEAIWKLFAHPLLIRLRGISQAVLPLEANPFTALNRFWHGIGVWWLAQSLTARSEFRQEHIAVNLPLAGLLHDAGNPPFSHHGEWFMREAIGHNGETHLREFLLGSELALELERLGADPLFICNLVAGRAEPWSQLLNGSVDLDNLDNVLRYAIGRGIRAVTYDPFRIIAGYRIAPDGKAIELDRTALWEVRKWQMARRAIYESVYGYPQQALEMMLFRALELAHAAGELPPEFWRLTDAVAVRHLETCNRGTRALIRGVMGLQPYRLVQSWEGKESPFGCAWDSWRVRKAVADELAAVAGVEPWEATAFVEMGRDRRQITLAVRGDDGERRSARREEDEPTYRLHAYLKHPPRQSAAAELSDLPAFAFRAIQDRLSA